MEHTVNFWQMHGFWFLMGMIIFPRITMLFFCGAPFGCLAWLGWAFLPRFLGAFLATYYYWDTNPILCVFAWIIFFVTFGGSGKAVSTKMKSGSTIKISINK